MPPKTTTKPATKTVTTKSKTAPKPAATKTTGKAPAKGATASTDTKKVEEDIAKMAIKKPLEPIEIGLKEVAPLVTMDGDIGNKCKESGRWMFLIDRNGNVHTFLKYRDVNMISVTSQHEFQAEPLRRALQGALRWGKPHIIDISDTDQTKALDLIKNAYDEIYKGCWDDLMSKKITEEEAITKIYRPNDDKELQNPYDYRISDFKFVVYTNVDPASYAHDTFFPVIIN